MNRGIGFSEWLLFEGAIGPESIRYDANGYPNFRVYIMNNGQIIGLEINKGGGYRFAGDMVSNDFGVTGALKGYKLYNWHSDLPTGAGYGPMFYDIAMEIATKNGGYLVSSTLLNRLGNVVGAKENKGGAGGDASDEAEAIYKFYYERRNDVEKVQPNIILANEPDQASKPYLYELYRKKPTILPRLIEMNGKGHPVLVSGTSFNAKPVIDMNFNVASQNPRAA